MSDTDTPRADNSSTPVGPSGPAPGGQSVLPPEDPSVTVSDRIRRQIGDALKLLDHAVESGFRTKEGQTLSPDTVATIKATAAKAGVTDTEPGPIVGIGKADDLSIKASEWVQFELAYYQLACVTAPVTAKTLRDTEGTGRWWLFDRSPAQTFTTFLWVATVAFAGFVVGGDWGMQRYGPVEDGEVDFANSVMQLVQILIPYAYGGLGSCVYLLRSAHIYIHERTFDLQRKPEYFNRIVLGTIGGGAIVLFINQIATDEGTLIQLSAAALGFIAGYSTDFLFNTLERLIGALLPKVGLETMRRAAPQARPALDIQGGMTLKDLMERFDKAQAKEEKELYKSLIEKLRDRL